MTAPLEGRALVEYIDAHLDRTMERIEKGYEPLWQAQADVGRTIITLASSTLVLSISVAQYLGAKNLPVSWGWLLPVAWVLFAISLLCAIIRQSWVTEARAVRALLESQRAEIRKQLWALMPGPDLGDRVDAILRDALTKAWEQPLRAIRVHDGLNQAMFWTFAGGIAALITFAIRNLPH